MLLLTQVLFTCIKAFDFCLFFAFIEAYLELSTEMIAEWGRGEV